MAETIREQIIQAIIGQLELIRKGATYNTDIGQAVVRARKAPDVSELPACNVLPGNEEVEKEYQKNSCTWQIRIEASAKFYNENPSVVTERMLGDLIYNISLPANKAASGGGFVEKIQYINGGPDEYPEEGHGIAGAFAVFEINYKTKIGDPYTQ